MNVNVRMVVEQMWQPMPGGSGRYTVKVADRLVDQDVRVIGITTRRGAGEPTPSEVGLTIPVLNLVLSRRALYAVWDRLGTPSVDRMLDVGSGRGAAAMHAATWAIPSTSRPLVVTAHDVAFLRDPDHFTAHGSAYLHRALETTRERADAITVPSQVTAGNCTEAGLDVSRITVIPHGLSHTPVTNTQVEEFRSRHELERPYVLWVDTREFRKNLPTLLAAYEQMRGTDSGLVLVGSAGWGTDSTDAPLPPERVRVLGCLDDADLACAYVGSRAFTSPSIWEGFGLSALEAMVYGAPAVTSADTCTVEITGSDAGLLIPATDVSVLAEVPETAADSEHDRLAAAGIERAGDYTWEASTAAHAAIYASLVGDR